jgi:hypothetical protein
LDHCDSQFYHKQAQPELCQGRDSFEAQKHVLADLHVPAAAGTSSVRSKKVGDRSGNTWESLACQAPHLIDHIDITTRKEYIVYMNSSESFRAGKLSHGQLNVWLSPRLQQLVAATINLVDRLAAAIRPLHSSVSAVDEQDVCLPELSTEKIPTTSSSTRYLLKSGRPSASGEIARVATPLSTTNETRSSSFQPPEINKTQLQDSAVHFTPSSTNTHRSFLAIVISLIVAIFWF